MNLPSIQLDAFFEVARMGSFTKAAHNLHITQPALSQRVLKLEQELGPLFIRDNKGLRLTYLGEELLGYCQIRSQLEKDFLEHLSGMKGPSLTGSLRVGSYSSLSRSVILPCLKNLLRENPHIHFEILTRPVRELPGLLKSKEADFILLDHEWDRKGTLAHPLGFEEYVLLTPPKGAPGQQIILDQDNEDNVTQKFLNAQKSEQYKGNNLTRWYVEDIYGIIDGIQMGLGQGVVPLHLIKGLVKEKKEFRPVKNLASLFLPVNLYYEERPFYSSLHKAALDQFLKSVPQLLGKGPS